MDENQTEEEIDILDIPDDEIDEYYSKLEESSNEEEVQQEESSDEGTNEEEDVEASQTISEPLSDDEEGDSTDEDDTDDSTASEEATELDYKQEYDKLLAPFKANGKEMQVSSIEDARQLMQMGANYTKKMKALAPNLKIVKLLENNGLLDEGKISFLIDLSRKDPNAVTKFLKDSNIDPLDLDMDNAEKYQPKAYTVSDKELELDSVLDEIKDTESFKVTADVIGNKWDEPSKKVILDNPVLIKIINEHVQAGIYEKIQSVVERERMLGRLVGLSDIEAYKQVGDVIQAQGGFNNQTQAGAFTASNIKATNKVDPSVAKRKKAASSTKSNAATKSSNDFNPLDMSDEEFEKIMSSKYI
jgi:hypothetical protein